jgi:hypothetical protein
LRGFDDDGVDDLCCGVGGEGGSDHIVMDVLHGIAVLDVVVKRGRDDKRGRARLHVTDVGRWQCGDCIFRHRGRERRPRHGRLHRTVATRATRGRLAGDGIERDQELAMRAEDEHAAIQSRRAIPATSATPMPVDAQPVAFARDLQVLEPVPVSHQQGLFLPGKDAREGDASTWDDARGEQISQGIQR